MKKLTQFFSFILELADKKDDTEEIKRQHGFLIYMGLLMSTGGLLWGTICLVYELYLPMVVPYSYIGITTLNFFYLYKTKNFEVSQNIQITISLLLPFFFQFFLGGFVASGGNVLWAVLAVFGSFTFRRRGKSITWLLLFILLMIFSGIVDDQAKRFDVGLDDEFIVSFFVFNFVMVIAIIFSLYYYFVRSEEKARIKLHESLQEVKMFQNQLIESEKMASLGSLVSGIAHEINTPLGIVLTSISHIENEIKRIEQNYKEESLTEDALVTYIEDTKKIVKIIGNQLNNAVILIRSFKNTSVDQHSEEQRVFNLKHYVDEIVISLQSVLKKGRVKVVNNIDPDIEVDSYPGIFSQIFSNLLINSMKHGFDYDTKQNFDNIVKIELEELEGLFYLRYEDNGKGISEGDEKKIFDPFYTTKRGQGGSGLGLNIVYNLVSQKLKGSLEVQKVVPQGLRFIMKLNIKVERH